jgi:hypothetical protein
MSGSGQGLALAYLLILVITARLRRSKFAVTLRSPDILPNPLDPVPKLVDT